MILPASVTAAFALFLSFVVASPIKESPVSYAGHKVVRFNVTNHDQYSTLLALKNEYHLDLWSSLRAGGLVDVRIEPDFLDLMMAKTGSIEKTVLIDDVQSLVDEEVKHSVAAHQDRAANIFSDYQDADTYISHLLSLPGTTEFTIGTTYEKRSIRGVKFGKGSKEIVMNGGIHAREWISPAVVTYVADALITGSSPLLEGFTFYIIPVLNVDGYAYSRSNDRMWRKNREPNTGSRCIGTDPNRNFPTQWSAAGASSSPCAQDYYGPSASSSREATALIKFVSGLKNVVSYYDLHSYSQLWMYAWGYTCEVEIPEYDDLNNAATAAVNAVKAVNGISFKYGQICNTIYQASGTTVDHMYGALKVKYAATIELRDTGSNGFVLPAKQIIPSGLEIVAGLSAFWNYAKDH